MSNTKATNIKLIREWPEEDDYNDVYYPPTRAYVLVSVDYAGMTYRVCASVGVRRCHEGSARAAGSVVPFVSAWWEEQTDLEPLPDAMACERVMFAIKRSSRRLLREAIKRRPS